MSLIDHLPERFKNRGTANAIMAPSAILLAGIGAAIGIITGLGIGGAIALAAVGWLGRVATLLTWGGGHNRIDPMSVADPWRTFVRQALDAQRRYAKAVSTASPGPLRDRLKEIGDRVDSGVQECWQISRRGDQLVDAIGNLDVAGTRQDLDTAKQAAKATPGDSQAGTVTALQAQLDSADRIIKVARDTQDKVRLLDARLDEAVARAVELSVRAQDVGELGGLGNDVDSLVSDLESLRLGLDEAGGVAKAAGAGG